MSKISQDGSQSPMQTEATMSYRIATARRSIVGNDMKVGDHESRIRLLVCDFDNATFVGSRGITDDSLRRDIGRYLISYLKVLQGGGHHTLFFPPEFAEDDYRPDVHFSLAGSRADRVPLDDIFRCTAEMINGYLSLLWYTCAFIARERGKRSRPVWDRSSSLAGYSSWLFPEYESKDWHVSLKFGEPTVTILCSREVILHFTLTEVRFYDISEFSEDREIVEKSEPDYRDWVIALIIDISASKTGIGIRPASARHTAEFTEYHEVREEHASACEVLTRFFVERYFKLVAATRLKYLFRRIHAEHLDVSSSGVDIDGSWWMLERTSGFSARILSSNVKQTTMEGFDVVIAVSQTSINAQILRLFKTHQSTRWTQGESYDIEIKAVTVRLLGLEEAPEMDETPAAEVSRDSDDESTLDGTTPTKGPTRVSRAIVTIHVTEATLQEIFTAKLVLEPTAEPHTIRDCQLAFEVEVRDCDHWDLEHTDYDTRPYPDPPTKDGDGIKRQEDYVLRHIYLDLRNARFAPEYSPWDDREYSDPEKIRARMTLAEHIKADYFSQLIACGMHILASVPLYSYTAAAAFHRLTSMAFRTFTADTAVAGGFTQEESTTRSEQILFVLGMVGGNPLPPVSFFKPSTSWLVRGRFSHGTLAISRHAFHSRLLALLARVNALTTLEPVSRKDHAKASADIVQQWAKHPERKREPCEWTPVDADEDMHSDRFEWRWFHERRVQEQGSRSSMRREYLIRCTTHNELELPDIATLSSGSLEIRMSGTLKLEISSTHSSHAWSTESSATWSVAIIIKTSTRGNVEVEIEGLDDIQQSPLKASIRRGSANIPDAYATLRNHLLKKEDFDGVLRELKELQGDWKYYYPASSPFTLCTPMSNLDGDLLFELRRSQTTVKRTTTTARFERRTRTGASASTLAADTLHVAAG
ncbi:hypothetical protein LXA43DRAFT_521299 [Ganoderma leucocontextum]|nr:hypothetical protein LXA43DRAFT_521299 [Ganoderma leucocontextum]